MKVTILGCGGSGGVPLIGGNWGSCNPANPRNRRRRVSILVESAGTRLLVDTSPDLREQLLDAGVGELDAVLFTHDHADHAHGIDELRAVAWNCRRKIDVYGSADTMGALGKRFPYVFDQVWSDDDLYKPFLTAHSVQENFRIGAIDVVTFEQEHGFGRKTLGYRFGPIAYSTDAVDLPEPAFAALAGIEVWIVDCLRREAHTTHAHLDKTLAWIRRVRPRRAILTHMNHTLDYDEVKRACPPGVEPGYDGLVVET